MKVNFWIHLLKIIWLTFGICIGATSPPLFYLLLFIFLLYWLVGILIGLRHNSDYPRLNYSLSTYWRFIFGPRHYLKDHVIILARVSSPYWLKEGTVMAMRKKLIFYRYLVYFDDPEFAPREFTWWDLY